MKSICAVLARFAPTLGLCSGLRSRLFLGGSSRSLFAAAVLVSICLGHRVASAQPPVEVVFDANADDRSNETVANRNSQIFTIYRTPGSSTDRLLFFGENLLRRVDSAGTNLLNPAFSTYGMAVYDFRSPLRIRAAALQGPLELVYEVGPNGSLTAPLINDTGVIGFLVRATNEHGLRDAYLRFPGEALTVLPDLGEDSQRQQPYLDEAGRLISVHRFTNPPRSELRRYSRALGAWEDLTPVIPGETLSVGNYLLSRGRPVALDGDFIFGTDSLTDNGRFLYRYDDATGNVSRILDTTSTRGGLMPAWVFFGDNGSLLIGADNLDPNFPERRIVYQRPDGTIIDMAGVIPSGESFIGAPQLPQMNFRGDVWLSTRDVATGRFSYYWFSGDGLFPVIEDTTLLLNSVTVTDRREVYFWTSDGTTFDLARLSVIPEPSGIVTSMLLSVCAISATYFRRLRR
jgi:hypothetical protein